MAAQHEKVKSRTAETGRWELLTGVGAFPLVLLCMWFGGGTHRFRPAELAFSLAAHIAFTVVQVTSSAWNMMFN